MAYARDTVLGQKLRVVRLVGQGGLGEVYEVEHLLTRHRRALKVLKAQWRSDTELVERFLREASAAGHIGNPHIVETYDAGTLEDGSPYLLMELLEGQSLDVVLRWNGRLDVGVATRLMMQVCDAVAAAHDAGIIHRDLKPENLFLLKRDGHHFVKVLDFGISKFDTGLTGHAKVTNTFTSLGTPLYMSPEQMRSSKDVDERSDVYALAVILYEAISGAPPFNAESFAELAAMALRGEAKSLDAVAPHVPLVLSRIVARAMAPDRTQRHPSVRAFAEELEPFASSGVTSLTELPRRGEGRAERRDVEEDAAVSAWGPTAPPGGATAPTTLPGGALTEEVPQVRPKGDTTVVPRRYGIVAAFAIAVLSSAGVGLWAARQGSETGVPEGDSVAADASVTSTKVEVAVLPPPVQVVHAGEQLVGERPTEPTTPDAGLVREKVVGIERPPQRVRDGGRASMVETAPPVKKPAAVRGLLSVTCNEDPCRVTLPSGLIEDAPINRLRSTSGFVQVKGGSGRSTKPFQVTFKSDDEVVRLKANTEDGTLRRE
ncbi:MAG: serine/threonine-protein kinase [Myxococcales bacterium]|nr:serine/threonine-protein kinase [Myxococcales bacterium]